MKIPKEVWIAIKPSVKHLKLFGLLVSKHILDQRRIKLDNKSERKIFIRYHSIRAYKLYNHVTQKVTSGEM